MMRLLGLVLKRFSVLGLAVFLVFGCCFVDFSVRAQVNDFYERSYEWNFNGHDYSWNLSIPRSLYEAYQNVPVFSRVRRGVGGYGFLTTTEDNYVKLLATKLNASAVSSGFDAFDTVSFVLAFVQSLPYTSDSVTTGHDEYPRFPVETLVDDGGDCEDTSILFATIVLLLGYGTVYLHPPDHLAVGVLGEEGIPGYYFVHNGGRYYYCETTGEGFGIGDMPDDFVNGTAQIYDIDEGQQFLADSVVLPSIVPDVSPTFSPESFPIILPSVSPSFSGGAELTPGPSKNSSPQFPDGSATGEGLFLPASMGWIVIIFLLLFAVIGWSLAFVYRSRKNR